MIDYVASGLERENYVDEYLLVYLRHLTMMDILKLKKSSSNDLIEIS